VHSPSAAGFCLQEVGCFAYQIVFGQGDSQILPVNLSAKSTLEMQDVLPIDQHENGLEQVIPVGASSCDVQE
jgi:hypothetical protein